MASEKTIAKGFVFGFVPGFVMGAVITSGEAFESEPPGKWGLIVGSIAGATGHSLPSWWQRAAKARFSFIEMGRVDVDDFFNYPQTGLTDHCNES